jgi:RNA polymerase sigma factor (sigma-70 family)
MPSEARICPQPPAPLAAPAMAAAAAGTAAPRDPVLRQARGVFRFLRMLGAPAPVADDLTQEAFVVAWRREKQHLPAAALGAFLRRTARNLWFAHCRRERRQHAVDLASAAERLCETLGDHGPDDAFVAAVQRCVQQLAPRSRQALELVYVDELERDAVARRLDLSPNGLKTLLQRARHVVIECARRHR